MIGNTVFIAKPGESYRSFRNINVFKNKQIMALFRIMIRCLVHTAPSLGGETTGVNKLRTLRLALGGREVYPEEKQTTRQVTFALSDKLPLHFQIVLSILRDLSTVTWQEKDESGG